MGILNHHLDILFSEASKNNFIMDKDVLCLSQQSVHLTLDHFSPFRFPIFHGGEGGGALQR